MATPTVGPQLKLPQLPASELGLENLPAFPIDAAGMLDTLIRLSMRFKQREQALQGLSKTYTIGGRTARAREFLFGHQPLEASEKAQPHSPTSSPSARRTWTSGRRRWTSRSPRRQPRPSGR